MAGTPRPGTLRSQWLGQQLRELRDSKGILLKEAAEYLQRDTATLSRYETGFYPIRRPDLLALLDLYGVSDPALREKLLNLSKDVWQKGWWDGYADDVAGSLIDYVWLESRASHIRSYASVVVPGLLQSPAYAQQAIRLDEPAATTEQVQRWHELRMTRQQILDTDDPPRLSAVLDESVLRRRIGSRNVMREQLCHLVELAALPTVEIRVLPLQAGALASVYGAFEVFRMPEPFPEVAYTETLAGAIYTEAPDISRFIHAYDGHKALSLGSAESVEMISAIAEDES
ncbi:helix-turn-helix transcriptional regulator [Actinomadura sp. BRA 177]|uniref:helix-turn-helix domain-containing protein n=1 Tax=Actinomadura sp. BRA 177 TaxID=2745202 RepID=UPI001595CB0C|nr:helix-turn-helix transcriptional regulator [Actinomadura sp. BRA 177]NVI86316.1 helix-turn-helix domain-containing protein [Actinomadura sp. BRA 177]